MDEKLKGDWREVCKTLAVCASHILFTTFAFPSLRQRLHRGERGRIFRDDRRTAGARRRHSGGLSAGARRRRLDQKTLRRLFGFYKENAQNGAGTCRHLPGPLRTVRREDGNGSLSAGLLPDRGRAARRARFPGLPVQPLVRRPQRIEKGGDRRGCCERDPSGRGARDRPAIAGDANIVAGVLSNLAAA